MIREEAIAVLESDAEYLYSQDSPYCREAYQMAIEALKAKPNSCKYWDSESHFCALRRPQAEVESDIDENWYSDEYRRIGEDERDEVKE
jgi:hypothetical protein